MTKSTDGHGAEPGAAARAWVERTLGRRIASVSRGGAAGRTFRIQLEGGGARFLKAHRARRKFDQELWAHRTIAAALGASPRLVGHVVLDRMWLLFEDGGRAAPRGAERDRAAGALLARLHGLPAEDDDPLPLCEALAGRAQSAGERARGVVEPELIRAAVARAQAPWPRGLPSPRRVPCHRDYAPYNWLNGASVPGRDAGLCAPLQVIDWEHARLDSCATDLDRALGSPDVDTDAFREGYGPLSDARAEELLRWTPIAALARIAWGAEHGDETLVASGRSRLSSSLRPSP